MEKEVKEENKKEKNIKLPKFATKILFYFIFVILIVLLAAVGIKLSHKFVTQEKTTKLGLEDVGILVTQTCYTTVLEDSKENREFFKLFDVPFTESRQIFSYDFEVDAAVDFDKIKIIKIDDDNKTIDIQMPRSEVYKPRLNPNSFKVYLDSESLFSRISLEKHNEALKKMQEQAEKDCVANNLLIAADDNAQRLMKGIVKGNSVYKDYNVNFIYKEEN